MNTQVRWYNSLAPRVDAYEKASRTKPPNAIQRLWYSLAQPLVPILARSAAPGSPANLPGPAETEVVAADLRLRRRLAAQRGRSSTIVTGGLAGATARLTMPSLVGS